MRGRIVRGLVLAAGLLGASVARADQGSPPAFVAPAPQAGKGAAERADQALDVDAASAARLTDATLQRSGASGGPPAPTSEDVRAADAIRVYVITFGQGEAVWERFGHNALWIHDPGAAPTSPTTGACSTSRSRTSSGAS